MESSVIPVISFIVFISSIPAILRNSKEKPYDKNCFAAFWLQETHRLQEERRNLPGNSRFLPPFSAAVRRPYR
jgi:hypothetical protein